MNPLNRDKEYENLSVHRNLTVPGRAVINQLVVRSLIYEGLSAGAPLQQQSSFFGIAKPALEPFAPAPAPAPQYFQVETTCLIPLSLAGTGNWLNLKECAFYSDLTPEGLRGIRCLQVTDDGFNLEVRQPGIYKAECCIRIGTCGFGQHNFNIGLGIHDHLPLRSMSSCQSFGATLDLAGTASGFTMLEILEPNTIVQLYLRDDSPLATDANIFQGSMFFTPLQ
jgi:hypothetical protein